MYNKEYYEKNKEKVLTQQKIYYYKNKEKTNKERKNYKQSRVNYLKYYDIKSNGELKPIIINHYFITLYFN